VWSPDGTQPPEPGTDPMMPAIIDDASPPWNPPNTPAPDDRLPVGAAHADRRPEEPAIERGAAATAPARRPEPRAGRTDRAGGSDRAGRADRNGTAGARPRTVAELVAQTYGLGTAPGAERPRPPVIPPTAEQRPRPRGRAGASEMRSTCWGGDAFGERRYASSPLPPFPTPERPSLTGLTRRSMSRAGSMAFRLAFTAVFLLIVIQLLVSVFTR